MVALVVAADVGALQEPVLQGGLHLCAAVEGIVGAQVDLVPLSEAVFSGALGIRAVGRLFPPDHVTAVTRALQAIAVRLRLAVRKLANINRQAAGVGAPTNAQVHVVGEADIPVLVTEIAAGDAVGSRPERHPP